jgi:hypothetical protein
VAQFGIPLDKGVDMGFAYVTLVFFIVFTVEWVARSLAQ